MHPGCANHIPNQLDSWKDKKFNLSKVLEIFILGLRLFVEP
jgi:hypothetical protein